MKDFKKYFSQSIRNHYPSFADRMMDNIDKEFEIMLPDVKFAATSSNPIDRRLLFSAYFLALIKVLDLHGESYDRIREVSLEIVNEYVRPKSAFQQFMKKLPVKLIDFKLMQVALRIFAKKVRTQGILMVSLQQSHLTRKIPTDLAMESIFSSVGFVSCSRNRAMKNLPGSCARSMK